MEPLLWNIWLNKPCVSPQVRKVDGDFFVTVEAKLK